MRLDLVIRNGTIVDGLGGEPYQADVGISGDRIVEIGTVTTASDRTIDADGCLVTPGFVDIHTHYDGQVVWDERLVPSSWHGVTTVVIGNCGVGFAPCRPSDRDRLMSLMAGVEDIPEPIIADGLSWEWETFPQFLDALDRRARDIDIAVLLPHAAARLYVMGQRAVERQDATPDDIGRMRSIVAEAVAAGAVGVSTSRMAVHRDLSGEVTPTYSAQESELLGLALGLKDAGSGFFQVVSEWTQPSPEGEFAIFRRLVEASGRPCYFSLMDRSEEERVFDRLLRLSDRAVAEGVPVRPVVAPRAVGLMLGLELSQNPFSGTATYAKIAHLPLDQRVALLRDDPSLRAAVLTDDPTEFSTWPFLHRISPEGMFRFESPPNYEPDPATSIAALARRTGRPVAEVLLDALLDNDGHSFIYIPIVNYRNGDLSTSEQMLANPNTIMGLGDGGAHVAFILDAGFPTFLLEHWGKKKERFGVPDLVRRLTHDTASAAGLDDRGALVEGRRADLNIIDWDDLGFEHPYVTYDLPAGGRRLLQRATGFVATVVAGQVTYEDGVETGALPGRLVRGARR